MLRKAFAARQDGSTWVGRVAGVVVDVPVSPAAGAQQGVQQVVLHVDGQRGAVRLPQRCDAPDGLLGPPRHRQAVHVVAVLDAHACAQGDGVLTAADSAPQGLRTGASQKHTG